jgi:Sulfotransferase domain
LTYNRAIKIVGVGLNRTGTTTLGVCLQNLGYKHTSIHQEAFELLQQGNINALMRVVAKFDSFEDWPWPLVFRQIDKAYPGSKFILTKRKTATCWFDSLCKLATMTGPTEYRRYIYGHEMPQGYKNEFIDFYHRHNETVESYFRDKPGKLLVVAWENGDSWEELCTFLGHDVPEIPFPHVNRSDRLEQIMREQRSRLPPK